MGVVFFCLWVLYFVAKVLKGIYCYMGGEKKKKKGIFIQIRQAILFSENL